MSACPADGHLRAKKNPTLSTPSSICHRRVFSRSIEDIYFVEVGPSITPLAHEGCAVVGHHQLILGVSARSRGAPGPPRLSHEEVGQTLRRQHGVGVVRYRQLRVPLRLVSGGGGGGWEGYVAHVSFTFTRCSQSIFFASRLCYKLSGMLGRDLRTSFLNIQDDE